MQSGEKRSEQSGLQIRTAHPIKTTQTTKFFSAGLSTDILVPLSTLNLKKIKRAWDCCASILEKLDRGEASIDSPGNKYPYDEETKFASKITQKQITLTEAQRVEVEKMYRKGMTMAAIAYTVNHKYRP